MPMQELIQTVMLLVNWKHVSDNSSPVDGLPVLAAPLAVLLKST